MQTVYTKNEYHEFLIYYIRKSLTENRNVLQEEEFSIDEYEDNKWFTFLDILHKSGVLSKLLSLQRYDNINIRTRTNIIKKSIEDIDRVIIQS